MLTLRWVAGSLDRIVLNASGLWNTTTFGLPTTARSTQLNRREVGVRSITGVTTVAGLYVIYAILEPYIDGSDNSTLLYSFNTATLAWSYIATSPVFTFYRSVLASGPFDPAINPSPSPSVSAGCSAVLQPRAVLHSHVVLCCPGPYAFVSVALPLPVSGTS